MVLTDYIPFASTFQVGLMQVISWKRFSPGFFHSATSFINALGFFLMHFDLSAPVIGENNFILATALSIGHSWVFHFTVLLPSTFGSRWPPQFFHTFSRSPNWGLTLPPMWQFLRSRWSTVGGRTSQRWLYSRATWITETTQAVWRNGWWVTEGLSFKGRWSIVSIIWACPTRVKGRLCHSLREKALLFIV